MMPVMSDVMTAVRSGDVDELARLLSDVVDVAEISAWPLRYAVEAGNLEVLDVLLERGASPSEQQLEVLVSNAEHEEILLRLSAAGFNLLATDPMVLSVLRWHSVAVIESLIADAKADIRAVAARVEDALQGADIPVVEWCLGNGAVISRPRDEIFRDVLNREDGGAELVGRLFDAGVTAQGTDVLVAATSAKKKLATERVKALVAAGAEVRREGWTALAEAVYRNNQPLALWLLEEGAVPDVAVGQSPYDWKDFVGQLSVLDYARSKKGREWFVEAVDADSNKPPAALLVRDTAGFDRTQSYASLVYGRLVTAPREDEDAALRAAGLAEWVEGSEGQDLTVLGEGVVPETREFGLAVGVLMGQTSAEFGARRVDLSLDDAKKRLKAFKSSYWKELDKRFGFDFVDQRAAVWLVASGPLATAGLVYGVYTEPNEVTPGRGLETFRGSDGENSDARVAFGVVESTAERKKISLTPAALRSRAAKTGHLDNAVFILTARYD